MIDNLVGYWDFETNLANKGAGGSSYNATTLTGTPVAGVVTGKAGKALELIRAESDSIQLPVAGGTSGPLGQSFSVSAWFRHTGATDSSRAFVFEASSGFDVSFGTSTTANSYVSYVGETASGTAVLPGDAWHHVLHTFSSDGTTTTLEVYVDGAKQSYSPKTVSSSLMSFPGINVGTYRTANGRYFNGLVDEVAVWNRTLSDAEATQVYTLGSNGQAVPEPASGGLAAAAAVGLLARRRRVGGRR